MTRKKLRDLSAVFFIGLFLMTWEPVFIWLLVGALVVYLPYGKDSEHKEDRHQNILGQVKADALQYQVTMPNNYVIRNLLVQVYRRYNTALQLYPHLVAEYKEVLEEMWGSLSHDKSAEHWNQVLTTVLADWPNQTVASSETVKNKLKKAKELSQQWDEAKKEAMGGSHA